MGTTMLTEFLDANKVKYVTVTHSEAYTAQEIAALAHVKGKDLAKTVMIKVDGQLAMAVLPSSYHVDFNLLKQALGRNEVVLATEHDFVDKFVDCELGAMPPFGNLYDMDVYVAKSLSADEEIAFNACSHARLIRMKYADFARLVQPKILDFSEHD